MTRAKLLSLFVAAAMTCASSLAHSEQDSVLTFHGHADRSGHFVVPKLTWERARSVHLDERFHAPVSGHEGDNRLHGFAATLASRFFRATVERSPVFVAFKP